MKKLILSIFVSATVMLTSCGTEWLTEAQPGVTLLEDFYISGQAAIQNVNACYVPLMWEYNNTYSCEWWIGDVMSDDAVKGGQDTNDMGTVYNMENWQTISSNDILLDMYQFNYQGVARCNLVLTYVPDVEVDDEDFPQVTKDRVLAEAKFLRAMYYFRLVRIFGGVPLVDYIVDASSLWFQARATAAETYNFILTDLEDAQQYLWEKSEYDATDMGRATKGAAQAMLLKVNLYLASEGNAANRTLSQAEYYTAAKAWGDSIISGSEYGLLADYAENFTLEGENGDESVFEIQYIEESTSDYGEGSGFTRGNFTQTLTRSRSPNLGSGWGFNKPSQNLYDEFEAADSIRLFTTILNPTDDEIDNPTEEIYLGTRYVNRKTGLYYDDNTYYSLAHATRGPLNNTVIRYADVLLMYAEACLGAGDEGTATIYLNEVRNRVGLDAYPGYTFFINGEEITSPTLEEAIRHERRVELGMEGHRWFDLCRWGGLGAHMIAYQLTETTEYQGHLSSFIEGKHELFPIPSEEMDLNYALEQNPGY
ncbi:MAG: RagB/SusD family nutrient uptake outer membrane protein [bacterium]